MGQILVICAAYHNEDETLSFVAELLAQSRNSALQAIVVDNNEVPGRLAKLDAFAQTHPFVRVCRPGKNLGYFGGAAWGLNTSLRENPLPEWIVVCNTDIRFADSLFFARLLDHPDNPPAVIAPAIISQRTGLDQNPFLRNRPSPLRVHFKKWTLKTDLLRRVSYRAADVKASLKAQSSRWLRPADPAPCEADIYAGHGSFMIFNSRYFRAGGTLQHQPFLYGEEILVAEAARRLGLRIRYAPHLRVLHAGRSTTGGNPLAGRCLAAAAAYCADQYFPLFGHRNDG